MVDKSTSDPIETALDAELDLYKVAPLTMAFEAQLLELSPSALKPVARPKRGWLSGFFGPVLAGGGAAFASAVIGGVIGYQALTSTIVNDEASAFLTATSSEWSDEIWSGVEG